MPKFIVQHKTRQLLDKVSPERLEALARWIDMEITDALSARKPLEAMWQEDLRQYEGIPCSPIRNVPVENAPNIEVTIGAIAADSIYAQMIDLIFGVTPFVTAQAMPKGTDDDFTLKATKAVQRYANWMATNELNIRNTIEEFGLDFVQLGTAVIYTPWTIRIKKTRTMTIKASHPRSYAIPIEDYIRPSGSMLDDQDIAWVDLRFWRTWEELAEREKLDGWRLDGVQAVGARSWMRTKREMLGRQIEGVTAKGNIYDVHDIYCYFDIDGDGIDEDLYLIWNHTGRRIMKLAYNPQDHRPIEKACYQRRAHLPYGLGVLRMIAPYEEELTEVHNQYILNMLLANSRLWIGKEGRIPETMKVWAGKVITTLEGKDDLEGIQMADVYQSALQAQMLIMQLAENRVGMSAMSSPRPSQIMGSRTPGITAISMLQQINKRFTPAFDGAKGCIARSIKQAFYRYQERLKAGDVDVEAHIYAVLGPEEGSILVQVLKRDTFDEHVDIELTASSASVNREADRQSAVMLVNILAQYHQRMLELVSIAANPQTPEPVRDVAQKIASSASEIIDRTIRTFDQVRDPSTFIVDISDELDQAQSQLPQAGLQQLLGMLMGGGGDQQQKPLELPFGGGGG